MHTAAGLGEVLDMFPTVQAAFGYGSGVFQQPGLYSRTTGGKPMLDLIFAVESPLEWHEQNIAANRHHYSCLAAFGPKAVAGVADHIGAGTYFNTMVPWKGQLVKYGVVKTSTLASDLVRWDALYCAGRLHKPVAHVREYSPLQQAIQNNLAAAVGLALLQLPATFDSRQLLTRICEISYLADIRMAFAEDSRKVQKIVAGSWDGLQQLYAAPLAAAAALQQTAPQRWAQDVSPPARLERLACLPQNLLSGLAHKCGLPPLPVEPQSHTLPTATHLSASSGPEAAASRDHLSKIYSASPTEAARMSAAAAAAASAAVSEKPPDWNLRRSIAAATLARPKFARLLRASVGQIVRSSSRRQAVAGVLSAGLLRSVRYGAAKVGKYWRSRGAAPSTA